MGRVGARLAALLLSVAIAAGMVAGGAEVTQAAPVDPAQAEPGAQDSGLLEPERTVDAERLKLEVTDDELGELLGGEAGRSEDRAWMVTGTQDGLAVMLADVSDRMVWRTLAMLSVPGVDTDLWIGNACVTASGERLVVAYGPRGLANEPTAFLRGAYVAVVGLADGVVTYVDARSSLEYFTPSCGAGEMAVVSASGGEDRAATLITTIDAAAARVVSEVELDGQVTSAVPTESGTIAAVGAAIARVEAEGTVTPVVPAASVPFNLRRDSDGGVVYLEHDGKTAVVRRLGADALLPGAEIAAQRLATAPLDDVGLTTDAQGHVVVTGSAQVVGELPGSMRVLDVDSSAVASIHGDLLTRRTTGSLPLIEQDGSVDPTQVVDVARVEITSAESGRSTHVDALVVPGDESPGAEFPGPAAGSAQGAEASARTARQAGDPHDPVELERTCAVPRNDPALQATQPKPRQVEWAVNQAVKGVLDVRRPANWKGLGLPAYSPQGLFPPLTLDGGGEVPSQVMLGILAQESNLWQAPGYAAPGVTGNPLIGNYYGVRHTGTERERWDPDWDRADCGYGVAQVTDGMRLSDTGTAGRSSTQQHAIALDYAANVAAGLQILQAKWNETHRAGLTINDGDPSRIENWFFAVWAYNSGFYPEKDRFTDGRNGAWGVGWFNNPANPSYPANRKAFHENPADAKNPQLWPYPEKVLGFAAHPPSLLESPGVFVPAYRASWWPGEGAAGERNRRAVKPEIMTFCNPANECIPGSEATCIHRSPEGFYDQRCWYHSNATWKPDCSSTCGRPFLRFVPGYAYQEDGNAYPPACSRQGLPPGALIVDDTPQNVPSARPNCPRHEQNGTFTFDFSSWNTPGEYPSKMDLHQLGAGYGGHFWFGHTRSPFVRDGSMEFSGTWRLDRPLHQWTQVLVHLPDIGAQTRQAIYQIDPGYGGFHIRRNLLQRTQRNGWVPLGVFDIQGVPAVRLSTETPDGDDSGPLTTPRNDDIAFDAVAFVPLDSKPQEFVVALGDSYSSGEGGTSPGENAYYKETDLLGNDPVRRNACHRSPHAWSRQSTLSFSKTLGELADGFDPQLDYHLLACSGAEVFNLLPTEITLRGGQPLPQDAEGRAGTSRFGELTQLDRGFLDKNTTLVTLSVGGNDAGFSDVVSACVVEADCASAPWVTGGLPKREAVVRRIQEVVQPSIVTLLQQIHRQAPNADVALMGYPQLLSGTGCTLGISAEEAEWLNWLADVLADRMFIAVEEANEQSGKRFASFLDPRDAFLGRGICGTPENIHGYVLSKTPGEPTALVPPSGSPVSQQSFHPKPDGYTDYATVLDLYHFGTRRPVP